MPLRAQKDLRGDELARAGGTAPVAGRRRRLARLRARLRRRGGGIASQGVQPEHATWRELEDAQATGRPVWGRVVEAMGGGLALDLGGVRGFARRGDLLPWQRRDPHLCVGQRLEGTVRALDPANRSVGISPRQLGVERCRAALREERHLKCRVVSANRGGIVVDVFGMPGFVPRVELRRREAVEPGALVGRTWRGYVMAATAHRAVLSSLHPKARARRERRIAKLRPGAKLRVRVLALEPYGALVRLDRSGATGLVRRRDLSWEALRDPSEAVAPGQRAKAVLLRVAEAEEPDRPPLPILSVRETRPNPWRKLAARVSPGDLLECRVEAAAPRGLALGLVEHGGLRMFLPAEALSGPLDPEEHALLEGGRLWAEVERVDVEKGKLRIVRLVDRDGRELARALDPEG